MTPSGPSSELPRSLGVFDAVLVGLGAMLGAGIFAALGPAAAAGGSGLLAGLAVAGLIAYCNAVSSARLAVRYPVSGGAYVYGRERLGPFWGYLAGWAFIVGKTASCAAMALTVGFYLWPAHAHLVAVSAVVVVTVVNCAGVQKSAGVTRLIVLLVLAAYGYAKLFSGRAAYIHVGALIGAISWNLVTWWYGIPSSSSHALIGGIVGAVIAKAGIGEELPEVNFSDYGDTRYLHLGTEWVQGSMRLDTPFDIELEYVQRMMAWLLFVEPTSVTKRHAMQLGLGAGAITKFCHKKLRLCATAIELNPQVLAVCRAWFKLPPDGPKLRVVLADAAQEIRNPMWLGTVDALCVDLYDDNAAAPVLDSAEFYADCRALLSEGGCMTVNLFGRASSFAQSVEKLAAVFGEDALWAFKPTREGNTVVLAQRTPSRFKRGELAARCADIQERWGIPTAKWVRGFKPLAD